SLPDLDRPEQRVFVHVLVDILGVHGERIGPSYPELLVTAPAHVSLDEGAEVLRSLVIVAAGVQSPDLLCVLADKGIELGCFGRHTNSYEGVLTLAVHLPKAHCLRLFHALPDTALLFPAYPLFLKGVGASHGPVPQREHARAEGIANENTC